jgi:hypothetical protein
LVSEFLCAAQGCLYYIDTDHGNNLNGRSKIYIYIYIYATEIIKYGSGKNDDGWWNVEKMVLQTQKAIKIYNKSFPDDIVVFTFGNSSGHACKTANALVANQMNLRSSAKQPKMHNTFWTRETSAGEEQIPQSMDFDSEGKHSDN